MKERCVVCWLSVVNWLLTLHGTNNIKEHEYCVSSASTAVSRQTGNAN